MSDLSEPYTQQKPLQMAGVDPANVANSQSDIPLAHQAGEGMGALVWFSPIYGARAVPVKTATPSKK